MLHDIRHAVVQLARRPGFSAVAIVTLALGIGANTAVFSAVYGVLLSGPPFPSPDELQLIGQTLKAPDASGTVTSDQWSYPEYEKFKAAAPRLTTAAYTPFALSFNLATDDAPAPVALEFVSANYFDILGVRAIEGRTFAPSEDATPGTHPVVVISHRVWQSILGGDTSIIGRTIRLDDVALDVVGIMPPGFSGLSKGADVWTPMMMAPTLWFGNRLVQPRAFWHNVIARIDENEATLAAAAIATASRALTEEFAPTVGRTEIEFGLRGLADAWVDRPFSQALLLLWAAVACVLLIACVNLANLSLARGVRRARDLGLRIALGASLRHLLAQSLAEAVVLSVLGGAAAILVALWALALVTQLDPGVLSAPGEEPSVRLSLPVLAFNGTVSILAALAFGIAPAMFAVGRDPRSLLGGGRDRRGRAGPRRALVMVEVALATVLLIGAGLFLRSFDRLSAHPLGFETDNLFAAYINLPARSYTADEAVTLFGEAARRISARPGIESAVVSNCLPASSGRGPFSMTGSCDQGQMQIDGEPETSQTHDVWINMVSAGFFRTLEIPILEGRPFDGNDVADAAPVAIVTKSTASRFWPGRDPIGSRIQLSTGSGQSAEIVGVAGDTMGSTPREPSGPGVYLAFPQAAYESNFLVVRSSADPSQSAGIIRAVLRELDSALPLWNAETLGERVSRTTATDRFTTILLGLFALVALALAACGIYAVLAFRVAERMREVGIRMAIGATAREVSVMMFRDGLSSVAAGLAVGIGVAAVLGRYLQSQIYDVSTLDPTTFLAVAAVLLLVAAVACGLPALRASRTDPVVALHDE